MPSERRLVVWIWSPRPLIASALERLIRDLGHSPSFDAKESIDVALLDATQGVGDVSWPRIPTIVIAPEAWPGARASEDMRVVGVLRSTDDAEALAELLRKVGTSSS